MAVDRGTNTKPIHMVTIEINTYEEERVGMSILKLVGSRLVISTCIAGRIHKNYAYVLGFPGTG